MNKVTVLMPVYNDWHSAEKLIQAIHKTAELNGFFAQFVLVNDGSYEKPGLAVSNDRTVTIINLCRNLGHQRAIAIGLSWIHDNLSDHLGIIVMDADGEDAPESIPALMNAFSLNPDKIVFAGRFNRKENMFFRLNYFFYRIFFRILTGNRISFGNFSLIPAKMLRQLVYIPEIWNHYTGGILRSKIPFTIVPLIRGQRITGKSKMSFVALVMHGLSAVSVYIDVVAVRLLITFIFLSLLSFIGLIGVIGIKYFTKLAIPGWATSASSGLILIFLMALLISLFLSFIALNYRSQPAIIPVKNYKDLLIDLSENTNEI